MITVFVESLGVFAAGMPSWPEARTVLRGETPFAWQDLPLSTPPILPPAERRRCISSARLALTVAHEAVQRSDKDAPRQLACTFASSDGDSQVIIQIMESLAQEEPDVSPTRFANSVHNATAGYWSIATSMQLGASCISAFDDSFAAGLLEAAAQVADEGQDGLFVASDVRFQEPFFALRPIGADFGTAMVLTKQRSAKSLAALHISLTEREAATALPTWAPEAFASTPAAHALPLLAALASLPTSAGQSVCLDCLDQTLHVKVEAC
jgi:hypothetical protein